MANRCASHVERDVPRQDAKLYVTREGISRWSFQQQQCLAHVKALFSQKPSNLGSTSAAAYICAAAVIPDRECDDGPVTAQSRQTETIDNVKIPFHPESREITAFTTRAGLNQFRVLPLGPSNSPAVFNRAMRQVLQGIRGVEAFIGDILVHSSTFEEHLKVLEEVFQRLKSANMTVKPNASQEGVGAVLMQETDGEVYPVAYHSRKLKSAETNYSTVEKELLAVVDGIGKFYFYLYGDKFLLETDPMPLASLRTSKNANAHLIRWAMYLQQFNFAIRYLRGSAGVGADFLSSCGERLEEVGGIPAQRSVGVSEEHLSDQACEPVIKAVASAGILKKKYESI
ncbi:uncharacterized protein LOC125038980 [Penaeus chinensis]|uniref:uncharacterized protein LOC125038980 n=1 Tax=Penaeus chinensis TaxID=139456 RepID=UPI001FB6A0A0|nr:uncharacterized protein LOC125038980 [Penaeus chinensis]